MAEAASSSSRGGAVDPVLRVRVCCGMQPLFRAAGVPCGPDWPRAQALECYANRGGLFRALLGTDSLREPRVVLLRKALVVWY